jgi:hypothetical protein
VRRSDSSPTRDTARKKPRTIRAWALFVPKYGLWVPVNDRPNIPYLYPTRAKARRAALGRWDPVYQVEIRVVGRHSKRRKR